MPRGQGAYPDSTRKEYVDRRTRGETNLAICAAMGIDKKTGDMWWSRHKQRMLELGYAKAAPPKNMRKINQSAVARKAYHDFAYFRLIVFGYKTPPWALEAIEELRAAVEENRRSFVCMNVFPGAGKSSLMMHFCCWLIVRNRTIRIMWGSIAEHNAKKWVNEAKQAFMRVVPDGGYEDDVRAGRAVKPRYCLTQLFGSFMPSRHHGGKWSADEFTVSTVSDNLGEGPPPPGPTLVALSRKKEFLGKRANFIVWDDPWSKDQETNPELAAKTRRWFDGVAETRLHENGTLAVVMQRLGPNDLSHHVLSKQVPVRDPETGEETGWRPEYRHIVYPAHHDDLCDGTHPDGRPAWDPKSPKVGHCLTDPQALPPDDFLRVRGKPVYLIEYQQRDVDPETVLIPEVWLTGGRSEDGETFKGCLDLDRGLFQPPEGVPLGSVVSAMAIDPGSEGYWGLWWSLSGRDLNDHTEWLMAAHRKKMPAGTERGLLDWDFERETYVGLLDEWWQVSQSLGCPITHVVAEVNAAQRHLFRNTNVVNRWQLARNVRIIQHTTRTNKQDPKLGVEALIPIRYQLGAVRIPWRVGEARNQHKALYDEAKGYQAGSPTDDIIMAQWFLWLNRRRLVMQAVAVKDERPKDAPRGLAALSGAPKWVQGL